MRFLSAIHLSMAMHLIPEKMDALGRRLVPASDPRHSDKAAAFRQACADDNCKAVNQMLADALAEYLGTKELIYGLDQYCGKFGIEIADLSRKSDFEIIHAIASHRTKILERLAQEGV